MLSSVPARRRLPPRTVKEYPKVTRTVRASFAAASVVAGLLLSGCTVNAPAPVVPSDTAASQPAAEEPGAPADASTPAETNPSGGYWPAGVQVVQNPQLGHVVADGEGFTLYRFDDDTASPSTTTCYGDCATTWPPVLTRNKIVYTGIDQALLGTTTRDDGSLQVTLGGWPLYRFSGDTEPGQINGEAVGGVWFTAAPDGTKANGDE
ncbi:hypothetical protein ACFQHV_00760 [Promicromonospora thailandica]|uniref:Lipoprotein with Yx(FWY)xxD motif n=1 Tax=Promicromonospora thailandica TaxID=765201 RepID=A0A9X2FY57_9MICO|nr:hypothetical protein [Promicromonospora thailandica]MCP2262730.1 Secreted repeat of unknown function [Promicromonospora thailandica]BFF18054.1 hypothetical protein GCM10025730_15750 [Promicromonospora thailandica]